MYSSTPSLSVSSGQASASGAVGGAAGAAGAAGGAAVASVGGGGIVVASSVLAQFPPDAAHTVVTAIVKGVAGSIGLGLPGVLSSSTSVTPSSSGPSSGGLMGQPPSSLKTEAQIQWFMEVVCHGLSLPLAEHDTIKDCVNIYCEWLSALLPVTKSSVPPPIKDEPNRYARKIIGHLYHLFVPRKGEAQETIHKQAVLCHRVLRRIQDVVQQSLILDRETWEALLAFLLAINDALLAPPTVKDDVGDQLCERVLGVLYEIWLVACVKCFPSPPLWKTFREMAMNWRHRTGLIDQWNRVNLALTARLLSFMYGPEFPKMKIPDEDAQLVPSDMSNDCVAQAWYRFLHSLGNPVDLSKPSLVSQTQHFYQYAIVAENVIDPTHHPCLAALPGIFLKAMKGLSAMVDAYLGLFCGLDDLDWATSAWGPPYVEPDPTQACTAPPAPPGTPASASPMTPTPPFQRRNLILGLAHSHMPHVHLPHMHLRRTPPLEKTRAQSIDIAATPTFEFTSGLPRASQFIGLSRSSSTSTASTASHLAQTSATSLGVTAGVIEVHGIHERSALTTSRPKVNSLLHLYGKWLFEAAFIGTEFTHGQGHSQQQSQASGSLSSTGNSAHAAQSQKSSGKRPPSMNLELPQQANTRRASSSSQAAQTGGSLSSSSLGVAPDSSLELPSALSPERFESGRAEALGALCRIFCSKKTNEDILPVYLARFYLAVQQGLIIGPDKVVSEVVAMVLVNGVDLLRLDLDGVHVLLPYLIMALEAVLPERELRLRPTSVQKTDLRRAGIHILLSMLALPSHFQGLSIKELVPGFPLNNNDLGDGLTFQNLKPRLVNLLINALQVETEAINTQMLLGGLMFMVQDTAIWEDFETIGKRPTLEKASENRVDSAHALFVRATYLVCHRLISSWKSELNTSLAALELLSGLARLQLPGQDPLESKRAVKWLCDYIVTQCSRPPPAHSKDLHSTIVAAFKTLKLWLLGHPYLLQDKECLTTVLEVAEQGISGSKSKSKPSEEAVKKEEKTCSPASRRVRDAAEDLLACILEQVDYFPSSCGAESLSTLMDEVSLLQNCSEMSALSLPMHEAVQHFRYFVVDNGTIMAFLESPLKSLNKQEPRPTVTVLVRTCSNRSAWTLQLRQLPLHQSGDRPSGRVDPGRPLPLGEAGTRAATQPKFFPESIDRIPLCKADKSIPAVESVAGDERAAQELEHLSRLMEQQAHLEDQVVALGQEDTGYHFEVECKSPEPCEQFQTARLILSHLGLLQLSALRENMTSPVPKLIALESHESGFVNDLETLDRISPRTFDTVHIFFAKSGQKTAEEILQNVSSINAVHPHFMEFLSTLGWVVNVWRHPGWTGHVSTSWRVQTEPMTPPEQKSHGGAAFNGDHHVVYWADATTEIAFLVPTGNGFRGKQSSPTNSSLEAEPEASDITSSSRKVSGSSGLQRQTSALAHTQDLKMMVIWVEKLEETHDLPLDDLMAECCTGAESGGYTPLAKDAFIIFIQPLKSGLLRIKLQGQTAKLNFATPLVDGMIVSRRCLGAFVRQTSLNSAGRRRLDAETHHPPTVRRRLKVQEMAQKYRSPMTEPEFYAHLYSSTSI